MSETAQYALVFVLAATAFVSLVSVAIDWLDRNWRAEP